MRVRSGIVKVYEPTIVDDCELFAARWKQVRSPAPSAMGIVIEQQPNLPITVVLVGGRKWRFHSWDALEVISE